jgi:hypothetical protein
MGGTGAGSGSRRTDGGPGGVPAAAGQGVAGRHGGAGETPPGAGRSASGKPRGRRDGRGQRAALRSAHGAVPEGPRAAYEVQLLFFPSRRFLSGGCGGGDARGHLREGGVAGRDAGPRPGVRLGFAFPLDRRKIPGSRFLAVSNSRTSETTSSRAAPSEGCGTWRSSPRTPTPSSRGAPSIASSPSRCSSTCGTTGC